jgi:hypothetical protein
MQTVMSLEKKQLIDLRNDLSHGNRSSFRILKKTILNFITLPGGKPKPIKSLRQPTKRKNMK